MRSNFYSFSFEKLNTALPIVSATAKTAGVSLERTTALLGTLSDRGVDASTAATGLRNVFLELSKRGLTFEQAMNKINTATDKNAAALELFGKRGATIGVILSKTGKNVDDLTDTFITTIFIFIVIYLFTIIRSNYLISLIIIMCIIFFFIQNLKSKYNKIYNMRLKEFKLNTKQIKKRIYTILNSKK